MMVEHQDGVLFHFILRRKDNLDKNGRYVIPAQRSIIKGIRSDKRWAKRDKRNDTNLPKKFQTGRKEEYCESSIFNKHIYLKARYGLKSIKNLYLYRTLE